MDVKNKLPLFKDRFFYLVLETIMDLGDASLLM